MKRKTKAKETMDRLGVRKDIQEREKRDVRWLTAANILGKRVVPTQNKMGQGIAKDDYNVTIVGIQVYFH